MGLVVAKETEPGAGDRTQDLLAFRTLQGVLAIAQEGEITIDQPQQETPGAGDLLGINLLRRVGFEISRDLLHSRAILGQSSTDSRTSDRTRRSPSASASCSASPPLR